MLKRKRRKSVRRFFGSGLALSGGVALAVVIQAFMGSPAYSGDDTVSYQADPQEVARLDREAAACRADVNCFIHHMVTYANYAKGYFSASLREMHQVVRQTVDHACRGNTDPIRNAECLKDTLKAMVEDASGVRAARASDPDHNSGDSLLAEIRQQNNWMGDILEPICSVHPSDACFDANSSALLQEVIDAHDAMVGHFLNFMRWSVMKKKCGDAAGAEECSRAKSWKASDFVVTDVSTLHYRPSAPLPGAHGRYRLPPPSENNPTPGNPNVVVPPPRGPVSHAGGRTSPRTHSGSRGTRGRHGQHSNDPGDDSSGDQHGNGGTGGPGHGYGESGNGNGGGATGPTAPTHPRHPGAGGAGRGGIGSSPGSRHYNPSVAGPTGAPAPSGTFHPVPRHHPAPTGAHASTGVHAATGVHATTGARGATGASAPSGVHATTGVRAVTGASGPTGVHATTGWHAPLAPTAPSGAPAPSGVPAPTGSVGPTAPTGGAGATGVTGASHGASGSIGVGSPSGIAGGSGHGNGTGGGLESLDCSPARQGDERSKGRSTTSMADRLEGQSYIYECSVITFYPHNRSAVFLAGTARRIAAAYSGGIRACGSITDGLEWMDAQLDALEQTDASPQLTALHGDVKRLREGGCGAVDTELSNPRTGFLHDLLAWKRVVENGEPGSTIGFPPDIERFR